MLILPHPPHSSWSRRVHPCVCSRLVLQLCCCRIKKFPGQTELSLSAEVELISTTNDKKNTTRAPIQMEFQVGFARTRSSSALLCSAVYAAVQHLRGIRLLSKL